MKRHPKKVVKKAARAPVVRKGKEPEPHSVVEAEPYSVADTVNEGCLVTGPPDWDRMVATINENAALRHARAALVRDAAEIARLRAALVGLLHQVRPSQEAVDFATAALADAHEDAPMLMRERRALAERVRRNISKRLHHYNPMAGGCINFIDALDLDALLEER